MLTPAVVLAVLQQDFRLEQGADGDALFWFEPHLPSATFCFGLDGQPLAVEGVVDVPLTLDGVAKALAHPRFTPAAHRPGA